MGPSGVKPRREAVSGSGTRASIAISPPAPGHRWSYMQFSKDNSSLKHFHPRAKIMWQRGIVRLGKAETRVLTLSFSKCLSTNAKSIIDEVVVD